MIFHHSGILGVIFKATFILSNLFGILLMPREKSEEKDPWWNNTSIGKVGAYAMATSCSSAHLQHISP